MNLYKERIILLISFIFLIMLLCTPPNNPFLDIENVDLKIEVPEKPDGFKYCVDEKVRFKVTVIMPHLVKKVIIHFSENGDKDEKEITTNKSNNKVIFFDYEYREKGLKNVSFTVTFRESGNKKNYTHNIDIGVKPTIRNKKNLSFVGEIILGKSLILTVDHEEFSKAEYKWYKDSKLLSGQDQQSLIFDTLKESDAGQYYCIVRTDWGKDRSKTFNLNFKNTIELPKIIKHPQSIQSTAGKNAMFTIKATGEQLKYQWQKNEKNISGANDTLFEVKDLKIGDSATYRCIVSNNAGSDTSQSAIIIYDPTANDKKGPEITLITPKENSAIFSEKTASVTVTCIDSSGVASILCTFNGQQLKVAKEADNHYSVAVTGLAVGENTLTFTATDSSSNANTSSKVIILKHDPTSEDKTGPVITLVSPKESGISVTDASLTVSTICTDISSVASISCTVNGNEVTVHKGDNNNYSVVIAELIKGQNIVVFNAIDGSVNANTSSKSFVFTYDPTMNNKKNPEIEARDTAVVLNEDEALTFRLPVSDKENDELILIINKPIDETKAELVLPAGKVKSNSMMVTYKPRANKHGTDLFKYQVSDGNNTSREAIVSIKITPIDDKPAISLLTPSNGVTKISLDNQKLSYLSTDLDGNGIYHSILISEDSSQITKTSFRVDNVTGQSITIGKVLTPKTATKYYWLVIATDNSTNKLADTSEIRAFWTKNSKPVWTLNNSCKDTSKYYLNLNLNNYCKDPDGHSIQYRVLKGANTVLKENVLHTRADSQLVKLWAIDNFPAQPCTSEAEFIYYYKDPLMKFVPAGSIIDDKGHTANITKGFWIDSTEVTQKDYKTIIGTNPSFYIGDQKPVDNVTWFMAIMYCNKKSKMHGTDSVYSYESISTTHAQSLQCHWDRFGYRLPTEDEWELACDGGEKTDFFWGDSWGVYYPETPAEKENINKFVWWSGNNVPEGTKNVATKLPNKIGIYDLPGNVQEWCWDWHDLWTCKEGCGGRVNNRTDYKGATLGKERMAKGGGGYRGRAEYMQTSERGYREPILTDSNRGFRVVINSK